MKLVAVALLALTSCAAYRTATAPDGARFDLLQARQLGAFQRRLDVERHTGTADVWTEVGEAWVALATCREVAPSLGSDADPVATFMHAGLRVEALRRDGVRLSPSASGATLPARIAAARLFDLGAAEVPEGWIAWPAEEERWVDELPGPHAPASACAEARPEGDRQTLLQAELVATRRAVSAGDALAKDQRTGSLARLAWRLRVHGARLSEALEPGDAAAVLDWLAPVGSAPPGIPAAERARAHLLRAVHLLRTGEGARAEADLDAAFEAGLTGENLYLARALRLQRYVETGRHAEAVEGFETLPPPGSRHRGLHAWWLSRAHLATARDDRFLALAADVLRFAPPTDPVAAALYRRSLDILAEVPFEPRVVAVVESLGPPAHLHGRLSDLAETALERGRPENAEAAADWLLENHRNARHRHRYHALAALGAFGRGDAGRFRQVVKALVHRDAGVLAALPRARLARFHGDADQALATVLRRLVPRIAEWPLGSPRRRLWLTVIVDEVGGFLRTESPTLVRQELSELHRLAAGMLDAEPRGYAARVGRDGRRPLVLGRVRVPEAPTPPPGVDDRVSMPPPVSLVLVPADGVPPTDWASDFTEGDS